MRITFLGTGTSQGIPVIACDCIVCKSENAKDNRLRTSVMIEYLNKRFVIDTGPDFRQQMLREKVTRLDAVIFTHKHKDHIAGLDEVRSFNYVQQKDMPVYADALTSHGIKQEFSYIFDGNNYPGIPKVELHLIDEEPFEVQGINFVPIPVLHHKMPVLGFRIHNFAYITDANYIPPSSMDRLKGVEVMVLNALRYTEHISHFNVQQAIEVIQEIKPQRAYLTHISHLLGLHHEENAKLPHNIQLAYDGLKIEI